MRSKAAGRIALAKAVAGHGPVSIRRAAQIFCQPSVSPLQR